MNQSLRQLLIQRRDNTPAAQRLFLAHHAAHHIGCWDPLKRFKHIGCYLSFNGELPTRPIIQTLWKKHKNLYLPLLHQSGAPTLHFLPYSPSTPLRKNRFGIPEPVFNQHLERPARLLDLVLMPLVGFDRRGSRLGMGGGYYDRTFEFTRQNPNRRNRPTLLGVAMRCQETAGLVRQPWDVPLDGVLTEYGIQWFHKPSKTA